MKIHNKTYENVFSEDKPKHKTRLKIEKISIRGDMDLSEYTILFRDFLNDFYLRLYLDSVKLSWLRRKFSYYKMRTWLPINQNPPLLNGAFVKYLRRGIGKDIQVITKGKFFSKLELFFSELYPDFEEENPFVNPDYYKFPFKNISLEYMVVVHQLDDRIALLKHADEKEMTYAVFLDFIINHVYTENEILGRKRYTAPDWSRDFSFYVKDTDKNIHAKARRGRGKKKIK